MRPRTFTIGLATTIIVSFGGIAVAIAACGDGICQASEVTQNCPPCVVNGCGLPCTCGGTTCPQDCANCQTVSSAGGTQTGGGGGVNDPACTTSYPNCGDMLYHVCTGGQTPSFQPGANTQTCNTNPDPVNGPIGRCYTCTGGASSGSANSANSTNSANSIQSSSNASAVSSQQICPACFSACGVSSSTGSGGSNGSNASNGSNGSAGSNGSNTSQTGCTNPQFSLGNEVTVTSPDYQGKAIAGTLRCPAGYVVLGIGYKDSDTGNSDVVDGLTINCSKLQTDGQLTNPTGFFPNPDIDSGNTRALSTFTCAGNSAMTFIYQKDLDLTSPNPDFLDGVQRGCSPFSTSGVGALESYLANSDLDTNPRSIAGLSCPGGTVLVGLDYDEFGTSDPSQPDGTDSTAHLFCRPLQVACQQAKASTKKNSLVAQVATAPNPLLAQTTGGGTPTCSGAGTQMPTCPSGMSLMCPATPGGSASNPPMNGCYATMTYWQQVRVGCPAGQPLTQACLDNSCYNKIASSCELNGVPGCYRLGVRNVYLGAPTCVPSPSIDVKVNGSDGTITVPAGTSVTLSWTSNGVSNCNTGNSLAPWGQYITKSPSGSEQFTPTQSMTFGIQCSITINTNQIVEDSVAVIVLPSSNSSQSLANGGQTSSPLSFACLQCLANNCGPSQCTLVSSSSAKSSSQSSSNSSVSSSGSSASSLSNSSSSGSSCDAGGCSQFGGDSFCKSQGLACKPIAQFPYYQCTGLCGNGELDVGEQCDSGRACGTACCTSTCQISPTCACTLTGSSASGATGSMQSLAGGAAGNNCDPGYSCYNNETPCLHKGYAHEALQNGVQIICPNPDPDGINPGSTVGLCAKCVSVCGDGACEIDESNQTCPGDCHICAQGNSCFGEPGGLSGICPTLGYQSYIEQAGNKTCKPSQGAFGICGRCLGVCGDNKCTPGETQQTCPGDCFCGNGLCEYIFESSFNCPADCKPAGCGNGQYDVGEVCDSAWNSAQIEQYTGATCKDVIYQNVFRPNGTLKCSSNCLSFDVSACTQ